MQANRAATQLMTMLLGPERMTRPLNHMRMFLVLDELRPFVVDWPDVAAALLARARHERWPRRSIWRCYRPGANY